MKLVTAVVSIALVIVLVSGSASALHFVNPRPDFPTRDTARFTAPVRCNIAIGDFDYLTNIPAGQMNEASATVMNTGNREESITLSVFRGSSLVGTHSANVEPGDSMHGEFSYPALFSHELTLRAESSCGTVLTRFAHVDVYTKEDVQRPVFQLVKETETRIEISPAVFETELNRPFVVEVSVDTGSSESQEFSMQVSGVPDDWLSYEKEFSMSGKTRKFMLVTPRDLGDYTIQVSIASDKILHESEVYIFVAVPSGATERLDLGGQIIAVLKKAYEIIISKPAYMGALVISFLLLVITLGALSLRKEEYY